MRLVNEMLESSVICSSHSLYSSLALLVKKTKMTHSTFVSTNMPLTELLFHIDSLFQQLMKC